MKNKQQVGRRGEELAARYLRNKGMTILARNWTSRIGELDLVGVDQGELVAVEVKTRTTTAFGSPLDALDPNKVARLYKLIVRFRHEHELQCPIRVDAIAILGSGSRFQVDHRRRILP